MRTVSVTEAKKRLALVIDWAVNEPVVIRRQKRGVAVVLSVREYERLSKLNFKEFQAVSRQIGDHAVKQGLTEASLADMLHDA